MLISEKLALLSIKDGTDGALARFMVDNAHKLDTLTTRQIAQLSATSPATVVRFCKELGFEGFTDFRTSYDKELSYIEREHTEVNANRPFEAMDSPMRVASSIASLHEDAVQDTLALLNHDTLRDARDLVLDASTVHVFSAGTAMNLAESFRERMLKIGRFVSVPSNLNYQLYEADTLVPRSLAIIISYSGETASMLQIAKTCKKQGTPILALTSYGENSLSHYASCCMYMATRESIFASIGNFSTLTSVNLLLDILYSLVFQKDYKGNLSRKRTLVSELESRRTSSSSILMPHRDASKNGS